MPLLLSANCIVYVFVLTETRNYSYFVPVLTRHVCIDFFFGSDELKVIPQRIQNKKLNKLMLEFASGV